MIFTLILFIYSGEIQYLVQTIKTYATISFEYDTQNQIYTNSHHNNNNGNSNQNCSIPFE